MVDVAPTSPEAPKQYPHGLQLLHLAVVREARGEVLCPLYTFAYRSKNRSFRDLQSATQRQKWGALLTDCFRA